MPRRPSRPSQQDVARVAGVSQAVVSLVLNGKAATKSITPAVQDKIHAAAAALGYAPDVAARSLRGGRNNLLGVHTYEQVFPVEPENYYHEFLTGIEEHAAASGQDLVLFTSTQVADGTRSIYARGYNRLRLADGAIILGLERNDAELVRLAAESFPFVFIGRRDVPGAKAPYVAIDYASAVKDGVGLLTTLGHRTLAYIGGGSRSGPQEERRTAFAEHFPAPTAEFLVSVEAVTPEWLADRRDDGVTALVVETYELAEAVAAAAKRQGCEVPGDLSVVCLDSPPPGSPVAGWSYTAIPRRAAGARAVALLLARLDGEIPAGHVETLACEPLTDGSIAPPSHR